MATPADYLQQFISIINPEDDLTAEEVAQEIEEAKKKKVLMRMRKGVGWVRVTLFLDGPKLHRFPTPPRKDLKPNSLFVTCHKIQNYTL